MQLRTLFRSNRFNGCINRREELEFFGERAEPPLTLCCAMNSNSACLQLRDSCDTVDLHNLPLPDYIIERISFWNRWASYALEHEYEYTPSVYGLEAYATAIAIDIARALPTRRINYCGLPVHDDFALCLLMREHCVPGYDFNFRDPESTCPLPQDITPNRHLLHLLTETANSTLTLPQHGYRGWGDFDYCCGYLHFDPAELPYKWMGYGDSFSPRTTEGYPRWLCDLVTEWEESKLDALYENMRWRPCATLLHMQEDALAVDVARYHRPLVPIAMSNRFYTDEDILTLAAEG